MEHPHNQSSYSNYPPQLQIDVPDMTYASSNESHSPYTPDYHSATLPLATSYDFASFPQRLSEAHQKEPHSPSWQDSHGYISPRSGITSPTAEVIFPTGLPMHAPVPLSGQPSILFSDPRHVNYPSMKSDETPQEKLLSSHNFTFDTSSRDGNLSIAQNYSSLPLFPTPSELLVELAHKDGGRVGTGECGVSTDKRSETARKSRRRLLTKNVGFVPTEPDSISSHEKKRHYLECLEQYVVYLHEQLELVNTKPVPLERVSVTNSKGLAHPSIRTLLVHMENTTRKLNEKTVQEEQRFLRLSEELQRRSQERTW